MLPPPLLGEHTGQVLTEWLQMSAAEVDRLQQAGAL
jgi:crotonobetainyl-CoA:carnitine CoA-transferase CaiB-like acyl-CoA transferase